MIVLSLPFEKSDTRFSPFDYRWWYPKSFEPAAQPHWCKCLWKTINSSNLGLFFFFLFQLPNTTLIAEDINLSSNFNIRKPMEIWVNKWRMCNNRIKPVLHHLEMMSYCVKMNCWSVPRKQCILRTYYWFSDCFLLPWLLWLLLLLG